MYVSILEALSLHRDGLSFLNVGSGSGYLSCLVSALAGERTLCHGIDINPATVQHAAECTALWQLTRTNLDGDGGNKEPDSAASSSGDERSITRRLSVDPPAPVPVVTYVAGNCFNIDPSLAPLKYDRIYVGAGCPEDKWHFFRELLSPGGIIVLPIDDSSQLARVQMNSEHAFQLTTLASVHFSSLVGTDDNLNFPASDIAGEAECPCPYERVVLPRCPEWSPFTHSLFPRSFQRALAGIVYGRQMRRRRLPLHVWMHLFTFCPRDWFEPALDDAALLRRDLTEERQARAQAEQRLNAAQEHLRTLSYAHRADVVSNRFEHMRVCTICIACV